MEGLSKRDGVVFENFAKALISFRFNSITGAGSPSSEPAITSDGKRKSWNWRLSRKRKSKEEQEIEKLKAIKKKIKAGEVGEQDNLI